MRWHLLDDDDAAGRRTRIRIRRCLDSPQFTHVDYTDGRLKKMRYAAAAIAFLASSVSAFSVFGPKKAFLKPIVQPVRKISTEHVGTAVCISLTMLILDLFCRIDSRSGGPAWHL